LSYSGDTFIILSRSRGWWVVQRDPTGVGVVDTSESKQGWVPAGCLLETSVPVASAIAEAKQVSGPQPESPAKTPILPLSIISTSFPGIALMDYKKKGDEELDLAKDDQLRVFKRYNHWSYAVKEDGGDRGWVPVSSYAPYVSYVVPDIWKVLVYWKGSAERSTSSHPKH
jgi:protein STE50